jgi:hypothetical protein
MVAAGLVFHFFIAFSAALIFDLAARRWQVLLRHAAVCGLAFGLAWHVWMSFVVVPLSRTPKYPFNPTGWLIGLIPHLFFVGLPIALWARYFWRRQRRT